MIRTAPRFVALPNLNIGQTLSTWAAVARQRRALSHLDQASLNDVGISQEMATKEAQRPFWDAPDTWRA